MNEKGEALNSLYLIKPTYKKNTENLTPFTQDYRENFEKKLFYEIYEI